MYEAAGVCSPAITWNSNHHYDNHRYYNFIGLEKNAPKQQANN